jgi:hypothetical protein
LKHLSASTVGSVTPSQSRLQSEAGRLRAQLTPEVFAQVTAGGTPSFQYVHAEATRAAEALGNAQALRVSTAAPQMAAAKEITDALCDWSGGQVFVQVLSQAGRPAGWTVHHFRHGDSDEPVTGRSAKQQAQEAKAEIQALQAQATLPFPAAEA